jgi:ATP-dependent RNA helicase DeaD
LQFLNSVKGQRGIIFCRTKNATKKVAAQLIAKNVAADAIHGDLLQKERDKVMRAFKNGKLNIIVSTDIAARGIDVADLTYVVHYQLPDQDEYYTHRSGRTARAGKEGVSLVLANRYDIRKVRDYERNLKISFSKVKALK